MLGTCQLHMLTTTMHEVLSKAIIRALETRDWSDHYQPSPKAMKQRVEKNRSTRIWHANQAQWMEKFARSIALLGVDRWRMIAQTAATKAWSTTRCSCGQPMKGRQCSMTAGPAGECLLTSHDLCQAALIAMAAAPDAACFRTSRPHEPVWLIGDWETCVSLLLSPWNPSALPWLSLAFLESLTIYSCKCYL